MAVAGRKSTHKEVEYGKGHASGDHCGVCRYWSAPHCDLVKDPMQYGAMGWCKKFTRTSKVVKSESK